MSAIDDIIAERQRQIEVEGWIPEHDDEHGDGSLALAAATYAAYSRYPAGRMWPWDMRWWKPRSDRENLIRAAALLVAEIERLDRKYARGEL